MACAGTEPERLRGAPSERADMKTATISAKPARDGAAFAWTWRCAADRAVSKTSFDFYYDCLADARKHGYEVEIEQASGIMAPTGSGYTLPGPRS